MNEDHQARPPGPTDNEIEDLEERAAILEYAAGLEHPAAPDEPKKQPTRRARRCRSGTRRD